MSGYKLKGNKHSRSRECAKLRRAEQVATMPDWLKGSPPPLPVKPPEPPPAPAVK